MKKATPTRKTTSQELQQVIAWADDYSKFARECVKFQGKDGLPFLHDCPNPGQLRLRRLQDHLFDKVIWTVLKARQVGASSEIASQFTHLCLFTPGTSIAVAAQTSRGVRGMSRLYAHVAKHLPPVLRHGLFRAEITNERIFWPKLNSEIVFDTANSESFRGVPRQGAHLTECAFYANLNKTLDTLKPTIHGPTILESTANGPGDYHLLWNDAHVEHTFIGWTDDRTCVSDKPLPEDLTELEKQYISKHKLAPTQASWFVHQLRQSNWESFQQEHPATATEAFRLSGDRFFRKAFMPTGKPPEDQPYHVHCKPLAGHKYAIGADPASGSQVGDRSAFVVLDVTDPQCLRTALSFAARVAPREFGRVLAKVAKAYNQAIVCVERNAGWGLTVLEVLRQEGTRLYRGKVYDQTKKVYVDQFGWNTTGVTRPLMLAYMQDAVDSGVYQIDDPRIEEECNAFRHDDEGNPKAAPGCHDDLVLAAALALQAAGQAKAASPPEPPRKTLPVDPTVHEILQYEMATGEIVDDASDVGY